MPKVDEKTANFWTLIFTAITCITVVVGAAIAYFQYFDTKKKDSGTLINEKASINVQTAVAKLAAKQVFVNKRFELCEQASKDASTIANVNQTQYGWPSPTEIDFVALNSGPLRIVAGKEVNHAMDEIANCISTTMYQTPDPNKACTAPLVDLSRKLALACHSEIVNDFDLQLPPPENPTALPIKH